MTNSLEKCSVKQNCAHRYDCGWCEDYSDYQPYDIRIKSPRQLKKREKKVAERKIKKLADASKRGKANRRNGRAAERQVERLLNDIGLKAERTPLSGALKANNLIGNMKDKVAGDIRITINKEKTLRVECKRNIRSDAWYRLLDKGVIHIDGFCYGLRWQLFEYLVHGVLPDEQPVEVEDKRFKKLHSYFDQDDSDMVVVTKPYSQPLIFLREETYDFFKEEYCK